ncbi:MAG: 5-deoxy-glucuronate isomerase [Lachnospiraceae bacterium]
MEEKVFGYPEFDESGECICTTYDNAYRSQLMDIRVYQMKAGETRTFLKEKEEMALLLFNGTITLKWDAGEKQVSRKDVFTDGLWALHVCRNIEMVVTADADSEFILQATYNDREFPSRLYSAQDAPWGVVGEGKFGGNAVRKVNTIFDYNTAPYSNMVLGEIMNDRGNWSGYIPHSHPQPETYYFMFDRPEGFGASFVGDDVYKIKHRSFSAITPNETHPQACAPGYLMYTVWLIRHLDGNPWTDRIDDPDYTWLYDAKF